MGANGLKHVEARLAPGIEMVLHEARVEELLDRGRDVRPRVGDRLERVERRAAGKRGEHDAHVARGRLEQLHAPVHRRLQRPLPLRDVRGSADEERECFTEPLRRPLDYSEHAHASGSELDREREPVEGARDARERLRARLAQLELRHGLLRTRDVEPHGGDRRDRLEARLSLYGHLQRRHAELVLGRDPERDAARREDPELRGCIQ